MYRKGTFFRGPDDTTNAEDTVRKIIKNNQKPFLSDIDNLRISIEDNDDLIIPPNIRALGTKPSSKLITEKVDPNKFTPLVAPRSIFLNADFISGRELCQTLKVLLSATSGVNLFESTFSVIATKPKIQKVQNN